MLQLQQATFTVQHLYTQVLQNEPFICAPCLFGEESFMVHIESDSCDANRRDACWTPPTTHPHQPSSTVDKPQPLLSVLTWEFLYNPAHPRQCTPPPKRSTNEQCGNTAKTTYTVERRLYSLLALHCK